MAKIFKTLLKQMEGRTCFASEFCDFNLLLQNMFGFMIWFFVLQIKRYEHWFDGQKISGSVSKIILILFFSSHQLSLALSQTYHYPHHSFSPPLAYNEL